MDDRCTDVTRPIHFSQRWFLSFLVVMFIPVLMFLKFVLISNNAIKPGVGCDD